MICALGSCAQSVLALKTAWSVVARKDMLRCRKHCCAEEHSRRIRQGDTTAIVCSDACSCELQRLIADRKQIWAFTSGVQSNACRLTADARGAAASIAVLKFAADRQAT